MGKYNFKYLLFIFFIITQTSAWAITFEPYTLEPRWSDSYKKEVYLECRGSLACELICGIRRNSCQFSERPCRNCTGNNMMMDEIFHFLDKHYIRGEVIRLHYDFKRFLEKGAFASFWARSVYSGRHKYNSEELNQMFRNLCPKETVTDPVVFFSVHSVSRRIKLPRYISCDGQIYGLIKYYNVEVNAPKLRESKIN